MALRAIWPCPVSSWIILGPTQGVGRNNYVGAMAVAAMGLYTHMVITIKSLLRWPKWDDGGNMSLLMYV